MMAIILAFLLLLLIRHSDAIENNTCSCSTISNHARIIIGRKISVITNPSISCCVDSSNIISVKLLFSTDGTNSTTQLDNATFIEFSSLKNLDLSHNSISGIHRQAFAGLKQLVQLDLSYNEISRLLPSTFRNLTALEEIDLSGNKLPNIMQHSFPAHNFKLNVTNNPMICDCRNAWLAQSNHTVALEPGGSCQETSNISSTIHSLSSEYLKSETCPLLSANATDLSHKVLVFTNIVIDVPEAFQNVLYNSFIWTNPNNVTLTNQAVSDYLPQSLEPFNNKIQYGTVGIKFDSSSMIEILPNGSLHIRCIRYVVTGRWALTIYSADGDDLRMDFDLELDTELPGIYLNSLLVGFVSCCFMFFTAIVVSIVRLAVRTRCGRRNIHLIDTQSIRHLPFSPGQSANASGRLTPIVYPKSEVVTPNPRLWLPPDTLHEEDENELNENENNENQIFLVNYGDDLASEASGDDETSDQLPNESNWKLWLARLKPRRLNEEPHAAGTKIYMEELGDKLKATVEKRRKVMTKRVRQLHEGSANRMRHISARMEAGFHSGMESMRGQMRSVVEMCSTTSNIGQTVSVLSISTDVDSKEQTSSIQIHTEV